MHHVISTGNALTSGRDSCRGLAHHPAGAAYHHSMAPSINNTSGVRLPVAALLLAVQATGWAQDGTFTLYRSSVFDQSARVHVGTFDAADGADYNRENCELAGHLFQAQPGVKVRFWCERGTYTRNRR